MLVTMAVGGMISGAIHQTVSFKAQLAWGSAFLGSGALGFALWNTSMWAIAIEGAVFGLGLGLAYAAMTSVIVHSVEPHQTGSATGMNTNIRNIGGAIGTAIVTSSATADGLPTAAGYTGGFLFLSVTAAIAVVLSLLVPRARRET